MPETIFILGCGGMQIPALKIAGDMGWRVAAADGNAEAEGRNLCDIFYHVDLKDDIGLINAAREIHQNGGLDGVFTAGTDFSHSVALVAQALDLPGHSPEAALLATDKVLMRRKFRDAGVPSPAFAEIGPGDNAGSLTESIPGPWVVKPVDSMGSRGVVKIDRRENLEKALADARVYSRSGRALVESFMEGPEFSLDALIEDGKLLRCGLADRHIVYPPCFIEIGHTIPSAVNTEVSDAIWNVFEQGVHALGLHQGAAKGDVKLTPSGPMIGEIAARLSGGYMSGWTWPFASGVEPTRGGLRLAVGLDAGLREASESLICAERALIGIDGTIRSLRGSEEALELPGVREVFLRYATGDRISFPRNNVEKAGNVIVTGKNHAEADKRALAALRILHLELDPADLSTGIFLDAEGPFPPDAFDLTTGRDEELSNFLDKLWRAHAPRPSRGCNALPPLIHLPVNSTLSKCTDYAGRTILEVINELVEDGLITLGGAPSTAEGAPAASDFWKALIRGGQQGVRWYLEHRN